jgi:hypothetical protein
MTRAVGDEKLEEFARQQADLFRLVAEGTVDFEYASRAQQAISKPRKHSHRAGFNRVIQMRAGITAHALVTECREFFPVSMHANMDDVFSARMTGREYEVRVRERTEADVELAGKSAKDIKDEGILGITLEERLELEKDHFRRTGKHLDVKSETLCEGSRIMGLVPGIRWFDEELNISLYGLDFKGAYLRAREVVV